MKTNKVLTTAEVNMAIMSVHAIPSELPDRVYDALFDYFQAEMPYGTAKARTGDPYQWIDERLSFMTNAEIRAIFEIQHCSSSISK